MKSMLKPCDELYCGLERVTKALNDNLMVRKSHQPRLDSLLILHTFFKLKNVYLKGNYGEKLKLSKYQGVMYDLEKHNIFCRLQF